MGGETMLSKVRKRITFANVTMVAALLFALSGGAYAAGRVIIKSKSQISPKVLKEIEKKGPRGRAGEKGVPGANGINGKDGTNGINGKDGTNGANGKDGESVNVGTATGAECKEGGVKLSNATGTKHVCNGSPWTVGGTLPVGASETGEWTVTKSAHGLEFETAAISFTIPLENGLDEEHAHFILSGETDPTGCKGTVSAPEAESGYLCVFANPLSDAEKNILGRTVFGVSNEGADKFGAQIELISESEGVSTANGTWIVTG
jgi:hypothetical protein